MHRLSNIFWLGTKELRSVFSDMVMITFLIWSFSFAIYSEATSMGETVNNASIAVVDEDHSALSRHLVGTLYPPYFKNPVMIEASELDSLMDQSKFMFVLVIPPRFEADVRTIFHWLYGNQCLTFYRFVGRTEDEPCQVHPQDLVGLFGVMAHEEETSCE